jgi:hypothetical protein
VALQEGDLRAAGGSFKRDELAQALLEFAEELEQKPLPAESLPQGEAQPEVRRVGRRKGRRALANFDHLPVSTHVYEQRSCARCGEQRQEIGSEESWQIEYTPGHFERLQHVRKKYACSRCEQAGENPQIEAAAKAETAIEKGFAGPGLLSLLPASSLTTCLFIAWTTSSSGKALRLELRNRYGARMSRMWCSGHRRHDLSDAGAGTNAVGAHVGPGKSVQRLRLHVEPRTRGAERVSARLHRSSAGGCLWRLQRSGGRQRHHPCRKLVARAAECRRHQMDPQLYFMQPLMNLPPWPANDLDAWLPDRWKQAHAARCAALEIPPLDS